MPVRRELARARRRERGRCVRHRHRARRIEATHAWPVEHAAGWAGDGTGTEVGQDEHVGRPTARCRRKRCRIQVVGGNALASLASPRIGAVGHAPPAPCARWGVSRLTIEMRSTHASSRASEASRGICTYGSSHSWKRCLTIDGLGRNTQYMQHRGAPSAGVTWCNEQRRTRLPLLKKSTRCHVAPPAHYTRNTVVRRRPPARARCRTHLASEVGSVV